MAVPAIQMRAVPRPHGKKARTPRKRRENDGRRYLLGNTDGPRERIVVEIPMEVGPERCRALDAIGSAEASCEQARKWTNEARAKREELADALDKWPQIRALPRSRLTSVEWMDWLAVVAGEALDALDISMKGARASGEEIRLDEHARQLLRYGAVDALRLSHDQPPEAWIAQNHPLPAPIKRANS